MEYWITIFVDSSRTTPGMPSEPLVVASSTIESKLTILIVLNLSKVN